MQIESLKHPLLQDIRKAAQSGRPMEDGSIVLEGPNLVEEAASSRWPLVRILGTPSAKERWPRMAGGEVPFIEVAERALASVAGTETSQGLIALAKPAEWRPMDLFTEVPLVLVFDCLQDPGNAGTLIRSAEAFGATGVILCKGSVKVSNGKFLRATAGSIFRIPYMENVDNLEVLSLLSASQVRTYVLDARSTCSVSQVDLARSCALVIGNEGGGVSAPFRAGTMVGIPVMKVESLNAAVAGSIVLFEAARQRASS
jgi:TrmH family RNA methyltransferase